MDKSAAGNQCVGVVFCVGGDGGVPSHWPNADLDTGGVVDVEVVLWGVLSMGGMENG